MARLNPIDHNGLALYIHLPWCVQRCPYCDFNAHTAPNIVPEDTYIQALEQDLITSLNLITNQKNLISIFFGGGTPSLFSTEAITKIINMVDRYLPINKNCEITLEANPGTLDNNKLAGFNKAGINRLSLGVQSFNDKLLSKIGRIHNSSHALQAIKTAQELSFNSINIDLMFGLPSQTKQQVIDDLKQAIKLDLQHISWYELTIEPNTLFANQPPTRADNNIRAYWSKIGYRLLQEFQHYEVSAFAKPGFKCIHNSWIWEFGDYLGIGAGAHSKITINNQINRYVKLKHPKKYMQHKDKLAQHTITPPHEVIFEYFLNRLRLKKPITWQEATQLGRITPNDPRLITAINNGWITQTAEQLEVTDKGSWFLDDIISLFL